MTAGDIYTVAGNGLAEFSGNRGLATRAGPGGDIWSTHSQSPGYPASYPPKVAASYGGKGLGPLGAGPSASTDDEIGRASCRERVW